MTALALVCGCSGDEVVGIRLVPALRTECAIPAGSTSLVVTAFGEAGAVRTSIPLAEASATASLPLTTRQVSVEVIAGGDSPAAVGKSVPLDLVSAPDEVRVVTVPPQGMCQVSPLQRARRRPLVAPLPDGALVVGGEGAGGAEVSAERYALSTGSFLPVETPAILSAGFIGAALSPMADGRIVLTGGPHSAYVVFDPGVGEFDRPGLFELRSFHAAVALDDRRVLVGGGCREVVAGVCQAGSLLRSTTILDISTGVPTAGPALNLERIGGEAFLQASDQGPDAVVFTGGVDAGGVAVPAERLGLSGGPSQVLVGATGPGALLPSGTVITALAAGAAVPSGTAHTIVPQRPAPCPGRTTSPRNGAQLVAQEDGAVIAFAQPGVSLGLYHPQDGSWKELTPQGDARSGFADVGVSRLADGSVLVVGGQEDSAPSRLAHVYRPSLLGPWSATATVSPRTDLALGLIPTDPCQVTSATEYIVRSEAAGPGAVALVAGPRFDRGAMRATIRLMAGGVLATLRAAPTDRIDAELRPGQPVVVTAHSGGAQVRVCTGASVPDVGSGPTALAMSLRDGQLEVELAGETLARCANSSPPRPGLWGIGALDAGAVAIDTVTVQR